MKKLAIASIALAAALFSAGFAEAQATQRGVRVTIPFAFTMNDHSLPAGNYLFISNLADPPQITVQDDKDYKATDVGVRDPNGLDKASTLVFHKYGNQYFLNEISFDAPSTAVSFPPAEREKRAKNREEERDIRITGTMD
jgi:hypothetical protein